MTAFGGQIPRGKTHGAWQKPLKAWKYGAEGQDMTPVAGVGSVDAVRNL